MRPSQALKIRIFIVALVTLLILAYGFFQGRNLIIGPEIDIATPKNGEDISDPLINITGKATNITRITLNDRQIFVDKQGNFSEKMLIPVGYTIIKLAAHDKFGRTTQELVELNYTGTTENMSVISSTTTASSTDNIIQ
jgi:hypothetical protein